MDRIIKSSQLALDQSLTFVMPDLSLAIDWAGAYNDMLTPTFSPETANALAAEALGKIQSIVIEMAMRTWVEVRPAIAANDVWEDLE